MVTLATIMASTLRVFEGPDVFREHAAAWQDLLDRSLKETGTPYFFLQVRWLQTWAAHYSVGKRLFLAVAEDGEGKWVGGVPLMLGMGRAGRFQVAKLEFAGAPYMDCMTLLAVDDAACSETLRLILDWSQKELKGWVAFEMRELPAEGALASAIQSQAAAAKLPVYTKICSNAPLLDLKSFDEEGKVVSKNLRSNIKRRTKKLTKEGEAEFWFGFPDAKSWSALFEEIVQVEAASWKADGEARLLEGDSKIFSNELWSKLAPSGDLAVGTIRLDGKLIAYHWGFRSDGNRFLSYNLAYDSDFHNFSPGTLLMHHMAETGSNLGFEFLDGSRGGLDHAHLLERYHGGARLHVSATFYSPSFKAQIIRFLCHTLKRKAS
jgi:CelD/BcsL family acetyltransferase involved in cellulose biosynthesis